MKDNGKLRITTALILAIYIMNLSPGIYAAEARSAQNSIRVAAASGEGRVQEGAGGAASEERGGQKAALPGAGADKEGQKAGKLIRSAAGHNKEEKASRLIVAQEGGFVELGGARIDIPEGALKEDTEISIRHLDRTEETGESLYNVTAGGGAYRFEPAGLKFLKEVEISIAYTGILEGKEASIEDTYGYFYDVKEKKWVRLERKSIEKEKRIIHSITTHFTDMINATLTLPETANSLDFNINSIKELEAAKADAGVVRIEGLQADSFADANFQMRFEAVGGIGQMKPEVVVRYSSGRTNGVLGKGFEIQYASTIEIDTRWGLPTYSEADRYVKDGILLEKGSGGRYYSLKDSEYSLIEKKEEGGKSYWQVWEKDGKKKIYGRREDSWAGKNKGEKNIWYMESEEDSWGNAIGYEYEKEEGSVYIKQIRYTNRKGREGKYRIVFEYEGRKDIQVEGKGKYISEKRRRLKSIEQYYEDKQIKAWHFEYTQGLSGSSLLSKIEAYGRDNLEVQYAYEFEYEKVEGETTLVKRKSGKKEKRWEYRAV